MAEFCLDCWNKINEAKESKRKYIFSKDLDLCEGCGKWKSVIVMSRKAYYKRCIVLRIRIVYKAVLRLPMRIYLLLKHNR